MDPSPIFADTTFRGPELSDRRLLAELPAEYRELLERVNGLIAFGGGLHLRGLCEEPTWHGVGVVWGGAYTLSGLYDVVLASDVPFGQDCFGDQFFLRGESVSRLTGETGEAEDLQLSFSDFLESCRTDPVGFLALEPLVAYREGGG